MRYPLERFGLTPTDLSKTKGGEKTNNIKRDIKVLDEIAWYLQRKNFAKAFKLLNLKSDCYYKATDIIESQICDNINYDIVNKTTNAYQYVRHLKTDLEIILELKGN